MENVKRYYGADGNDKVLPWVFYRMVEAEHLKTQVMLTIAKRWRDD